MRGGPRRGAPRARPTTENTNDPRINDRIRVPRVLVIDEAGAKLGEFLTEDAIKLAAERGLDLVEVAPKARPPVCKIADFGKMKYERSKRDAAARRNQVQQQIKEVKLRPKTDDHDIDVKVKHTRRFLEAGNKVKITVRFRGREMAHRDIGAQQCELVAERVADVGAVESPPRMDGRQMFIILTPTKKPVPRTSAKEEEPLPPLDDDTDDTSDAVENPVEDAAGDADAG